MNCPATKSLRRAMAGKSGEFRDITRDRMRHALRRVAASEERNRRERWT